MALRHRRKPCDKAPPDAGRHDHALDRLASVQPDRSRATFDDLVVDEDANAELLSVISQAIDELPDSDPEVVLLNAMSDPLDLAREFAPVAEHQPELIERVRNDLMATITQQPRPEDASAPPRRARLRWAIPIAAAIVMATAAARWAMLRDSSNSTNLQCPDNVVIDAITGDPVLDCTNEWNRSNGTEAATMVAYDNGNGGISVLCASEAAPDGYVVLDSGTAQNTTLIELEAALDDTGEGLSADCYSDADAEASTLRNRPVSC